MISEREREKKKDSKTHTHNVITAEDKLHLNFSPLIFAFLHLGTH